jgi:thioredoxin reductase (NADPH)
VSRPTILAIDADEGSLRAIEGELLERYRASYRVVCVATTAAAEAELGRVADAGEEVALVLAGESLDGTPGREILGRARSSTSRRSGRC